MDISTLNTKLSEGDIGKSGMFPHLDRLKQMKYIFEIDFGLTSLPLEPGILLIRGARQYGKSTWLEQELFNTIKEFGPGSAYYLNGENISDADHLENEIDGLLNAYSSKTAVRRLFIDEITAINNWEIALKRMVDSGKLSKVLIITTGSKATDLRRGAEKLPGRKGKLDRTSYLFTPISYHEFKKVCGKTLGKNCLLAYLISGGSPIACSELASRGVIPEYVIELVRDWIDGEIAASGRTRSSLVNIMNVLYRLAATPVGQAKLAREAGLANNTVAHGYIEILNDLGCVIPSYPWDQHRSQLILRKPCKYHFTNLLAAVAYLPIRIRSVNDFMELTEKQQSVWYEWLIAQELQRRAAYSGREILAPLAYWQNKNHEIDFVEHGENYIEVKRGKSSVIEFSWFPKQIPHKQLIVINLNKFETDRIKGLRLEEFLLDESRS